MGEIIEHCDNGKIETVRVGDEESKVSIKIYQDVYHQVTGRTEQIRKRYSENLLIDFSEIEQLHFKVKQLCDVHNVVASNLVVSVFHEKERKEQFTSFERFRTYNSNASSPTVNVVLKYNFSIIPAGLDRPQEYVITIRLNSRIAVLKQIEDDAPAFVRGRILGYMTGNTAEITVEYADYIIARGFLEAFDEWIRGCKSTPDVPWLKFIQRWSDILPKASKAISAFLIIFFALKAVPVFFTTQVTPEIWARFFIIFSGSFYLLTTFMGNTASLIEEAIDSYTVLSYLKFNRGDTNLIGEFSRRQRWVLLKFFLSLSLTIILGVVSSKLATLI